MKEFVHLHLHTEYSLLDGAARIAKVTKVAKEYGMPAIAITDHGNMYGAVHFFDACKKVGIKAIIGCEFYVAEDLYKKCGKTKLAHLVLLAKDEAGYKNLCKLNTIAFKDGFYYKPRIDYNVLKEHSEGLVCLSACLAGDIPQLILHNMFDEAKNLVKWFKDVFKDDFYLELQNHHLEEQIIVNAKLREWAKELDIKTVVTNDVHYIYKDDAEMQDVLMCVAMQKNIDDPDRLKFPNDEFYFKTYDQMAEVFPEDLDALDRTVEIANKCNYQFEYGHYLFPPYIPEDGSTPEEFILKLIDEGLHKRFEVITDEIKKRIDSEFQLIKKQGFIQYFLVVWDYINAARKKGIPVGPGRGSGAGSLVAYSIGITNINPLKYDLLFERFLHSERVSAPDFDVDFADYRREEVIDYVKEKYTTDRVVKIATFGTMAAKNAIKDVGRVLRVPYSELDRITKAIPSKVTKPEVIKKCFGMYNAKPGDKDFGVNYAVGELVDIYNSNEELKRVIDIAIKVEDMPRQVSTHACGVVIGADKLDKFMPLARNGEDITTQYNMIQIEHLGHLKMDFLGLRNLSDIEMAIKYIKENYNVEIDFDKSNYDDPEVFKMISTGNTKAIFQLESQGFQKFMRELQPTCIEDIIAGVSLYRPGPMDSIPKYVYNKHNPEKVTYDHPILEPILSVTYGCIVYQEQVMKVVQDMAGYTLGQADMVRRMMGKKQKDAMIKEKQVFLFGRPALDKSPAIDGAVKRGVPEKVAENVWSQMENFASYAFNKSHAAAYSLITYQTAYLKCYYEPEFLTSVLNNRITSADEIKNYVTYAKEEKIEVLPPDINLSETYFSVKDKKIRFGLAALKNVGVGVVDSIINERKLNGKYKSLQDFISRIDTQGLNKRCIESMILSGALDSLGLKRSQMMQVYSIIIDRVVADRKRKETGQFSMFDQMLQDDIFDDIKIPDISEYDEQQKLKLEKEVVGIYVSGHPLSKYIEKFNGFNLTADMLNLDVEETSNEDDLESEKVEDLGLTDNMDVKCGGLITEVKKLYTKKDNKEMCFVKLEDLYGTIDILFFPKVYGRCKNLLETDKLVTITGKLSVRTDEKPTVVADDVALWNTDNLEISKDINPKSLYLKFDTTDTKLYEEIERILNKYKGNSEVKVKCSSLNQSFKMQNKVNCESKIFDELVSLLGNSCVKIL